MEDFVFITHENHDAYFNLASEEYLLRQKGCNCVYLWRNAPAVIVGVNQNTVREVNLGYTESHGIKVVRRQTGGGAVYHDLQNVCFTFIAPYDDTADNYRKFTAPVIEYLNSLGVKAEFSGRNDITVGGKKISGNAQTVFGDKIMHHGTLLFNTDMSVLTYALKENKLKIESKGIKSIRARVTNISNELGGKISVETFLNGLREYFGKGLKKYDFTAEDLAAINKLVEEKYSKYEWNIGRSPKGENKFEDRFAFGTFALTFDTEDGLIKNAEIFGDFFSFKPVVKIAEKLEGVRFVKADIIKALDGIDEYIKGADAKEIADRLFV